MVHLPPDKLPEVFQIMLKYPESRSHLLFLGPPGSSKTTTAQSFATALHGKESNRFASLLFLNSSDERSLETMRQKVYPFVESHMQNLFFQEGQVPPKVIIFDEAETLTDQAQCALRPLLQRPTSEVILIFICNSLSHIHPQILNKFLIVPFEPTSENMLEKILGHHVPSLDSLFRRGDLRFFKQCSKESEFVTEFLFKFLHARTPDEVFSLASAPGTPMRDRISWYLLLHITFSNILPRELSLWSSLTSSETQPYLDETVLKGILWRLWKQRQDSIWSALSMSDKN
jgi:hypothetical protein